MTETTENLNEEASRESENVNQENSAEQENSATNEVGAKAEELSRLAESYKNDLLRERAEFTNFRKRVVLEKAQLSEAVSGKMLSQLLPALDSFDLFFSSSEKKAETDTALKSVLDGVKLIHRQILSVFTDAGVEEYNPLGEEFDPSAMEALSMIESDTEEKETVSQVFQKGYRIQGKVIRPARVVVTRPASAKKQESEENSGEPQP